MTKTISKLAKQEKIIERGLASFVEVGNALMRIRDQELYREAGFDGFVEYLESKSWGISERWAYRQIEGVKVLDALDLQDPANGPNLEQAEVLAPLLRREGADAVKEVYEEVTTRTNGKTTARKLREEVQKRLPLKPEKKKRQTTLTAAALIGQAVFATSVARNAFRHFKKIPHDEIPHLLEQAEEAITQWGVIAETLRALQGKENV